VVGCDHLSSFLACGRQLQVVILFSSRRPHTSSVSAFLLNRSSDLLTESLVDGERSRSSYFATFRYQLTILSKTDALDEEKWLNKIGRASCRERGEAEVGAGCGRERWAVGEARRWSRK